MKDERDEALDAAANALHDIAVAMTARELIAKNPGSRIGALVAMGMKTDEKIAKLATDAFAALARVRGTVIKLPERETNDAA